jgi:copper homeostasis protein CutC
MTEVVNNIVSNDSTKINVMLGYTLNMGNFQSLRIDVGIEDSKRNGENANDAFERVYSFVEQKLREKIKENQED